MRRLAFSLIASCGLAMLVACSGGGFGLNFSTGTTSRVPDSITFQNGSASVNDFFLSPTGNSPILVNATGIKGTGSGSVVIPDLVFTWAAVYAPSGTPYLKGGSPNAQGSCGAPPSNFPINSLLLQGPAQSGFSGYPLYNGFYNQLLAQNPPAAGPIGSFPTYTQTAATIFVGVPLVPGPGPGNAFSPTGTPVAAASASYCITLLATEPLSGRQGSTTVVVSQSP